MKFKLKSAFLVLVCLIAVPMTAQITFDDDVSGVKNGEQMNTMQSPLNTKVADAAKMEELVNLQTLQTRDISLSVVSNQVMPHATKVKRASNESVLKMTSPTAIKR